MVFPLEFEQPCTIAHTEILLGELLPFPEQEFVFLFQEKGAMQWQSPFMGTVPKGHMNANEPLSLIQKPRFRENYWPGGQVLSWWGMGSHARVISFHVSPLEHWLGASPVYYPEQS